MPEQRSATPDQLDAMRLYANLLAEAKLRINVVEAALNGKIPMAGPFLHETCFLQLRFLCELIALGCLVVHGDIEATQKGRIRRTWSAEEIIERLGEIHPAFYPIPHRQQRADNGWHLMALKDGFLTKEDLLKLYAECGSHLHRGSLKKILNTPEPTQFNFPDVLEPLQKVGNLLSFHMIPLFQEGTLLLTVLYNKDDNGRVQVSFASATDTQNQSAP